MIAHKFTVGTDFGIYFSSDLPLARQLHSSPLATQLLSSPLALEPPNSSRICCRLEYPAKGDPPYSGQIGETLSGEIGDH